MRPLGLTSSFKTATSPAHSTKALHHHRERVFSEDFSSLHQDDFWSHPVGAVVGLSSSFTYTSLLSQQKNRRHSFSQDAANQGSQSPRWAPDLATSRRNFIPSIPKASFSPRPQFSPSSPCSLCPKQSHLLITMNRIVCGSTGTRTNFQIQAR